jgi:nucleoside-diphosphate-sugar epimerase
VVSPAALTLRGYAEAVAGRYGRAANLRFVPWEEWREGVSERDAATTWDHIAHSPNCSIDKAVRALGYWPRYGSLEAVWEALDWMTEHGTIDAG